MMGLVRVKGMLSAVNGAPKWAEVEFIVDTGAMWTMVPAPVLERLGIKPHSQRPFKLASGEVSRFPVGDARVRIEGLETPTLVVFGAKGSLPLLGVTALELLGLEVDPVGGKLKPMELMLL